MAWAGGACLLKLGRLPASEMRFPAFDVPPMQASVFEYMPVYATAARPPQPPRSCSR